MDTEHNPWQIIHDNFSNIQVVLKEYTEHYAPGYRGSREHEWALVGSWTLAWALNWYIGYKEEAGKMYILTGEMGVEIYVLCLKNFRKVMWLEMCLLCGSGEVRSLDGDYLPLTDHQWLSLRLCLVYSSPVGKQTFQYHKKLTCDEQQIETHLFTKCTSAFCKNSGNLPAAFFT